VLDPMVALIVAISVGLFFWLCYVVASSLLFFVLNAISTMHENSDK
jgi:hypothetical protein